MPNFGDIFGGSNIKSIQRGVISVSYTTDTQAVAITPVNPAFSSLALLGVTRSGPSSSDDIAAPSGYITLTGGGTSITAKSARINGTVSGMSVIVDRYLSWELKEYYPS